MTPRAWASVLLLAAIFWASLIVALWLILAPKVGGDEAWHDSGPVPQTAFVAIRSAGPAAQRPLEVGATGMSANDDRTLVTAPTLHQPPTRKEVPSDRVSLGSVTPAPSTAPHSSTLTGLASTYGPGYDGYMALPSGPGHRVRICGAGGCVVETSNDTGPVPSLHRVADLDVATFERVCGVPWTRGLCRVSVEVILP